VPRLITVKEDTSRVNTKQPCIFHLSTVLLITITQTLHDRRLVSGRTDRETDRQGSRTRSRTPIETASGLQLKIDLTHRVVLVGWKTW